MDSTQSVAWTKELAEISSTSYVMRGHTTKTSTRLNSSDCLRSSGRFSRPKRNSFRREDPNVIAWQEKSGRRQRLGNLEAKAANDLGRRVDYHRRQGFPTNSLILSHP